MLYKLRRIIIKLEKKINFTLFFLFPFRFLLVFLEIIFLKKSKKLTKYSNYLLDNEKIENKDLSIVSAGVGTDISFEEKVAKDFSVKFAILIDPGSESQELVSKRKDFFFEKFALFNESKKIKIYKVEGNKNMSLENLFDSKKYDLVNTIMIDQIVKKYNLDQLDILKLDVEGVADIIIKDCINKNIFPNQICFELERPIKLSKQFNYFARFIKIILLLKKYKYKLYNCTKLKLGLRSEILAVKDANY